MFNFKYVQLVGTRNQVRFKDTCGIGHKFLRKIHHKCLPTCLAKYVTIFYFIYAKTLFFASMLSVFLYFFDKSTVCICFLFCVCVCACV